MNNKDCVMSTGVNVFTNHIVFVRVYLAHLDPQEPQ